MQYAVVIEEGPKTFGAYVPDLPGCIAVAESRAEVIQLIQEAIVFHLQGLKEQGERYSPTFVIGRICQRRRIISAEGSFSVCISLPCDAFLLPYVLA